ncbi:MAG: hypothetical protein WAQ53_04025 [Thiofilum sp.]|uniref:hypothetical protein n=1 Tax=Thiofilum sp. TaxID=2212733 RepID=UPI0025E0F085|nr:hypothetical protein [Thiofilum sp.]MBK8454859.1 hypothetical protein [Thiofilum sp.]
MNSFFSWYKPLGFGVFLLILITFGSDYALAHVKWFVDMEVEDALQPLGSHPARRYVPILLIIASWGIILFGAVDYFLSNLVPKNFTIANHFFNQHQDIGLTVARIGTGIYCLILWLTGDSILAPELTYQDADWVAYLQLVIAFAMLFELTLSVAGIGLIILYAYAVWQYGIFHCLDYFFVLGLGIYLIISGLPVLREWFDTQRYALLYFCLVFAFLWSAIEKVAYPDAFYQFLAKYPHLTMGLDRDFFIMAAAIVEFALFMLLLFSHKGMLLLALLANLLISAGNIYFGKMDAIGHWPVNFILLIMLLKGPLPVNEWFFNQTAPQSWFNLRNLLTFYAALALFIVAYYGLHNAMYGGFI